MGVSSKRSCRSSQNRSTSASSALLVGAQTWITVILNDLPWKQTKYRNGMDLTEAEDIKKRWQEYTEEPNKKDLHDPDNHDNLGDHSPRARHPEM